MGKRKKNDDINVPDLMGKGITYVYCYDGSVSGFLSGASDWHSFCESGIFYYGGVHLSVPDAVCFCLQRDFTHKRAAENRI